MTTEKALEWRELDFEIVHKVFGLTVLGPGCHDSAIGWVEAQFVPRYSQDIAAAWSVVEAMERRGYHCCIRTPFEPGQPYWAGLTPHGVTGWNGRPDFEALAESAPRAICRAALLAVAAIESQMNSDMNR